MPAASDRLIWVDLEMTGLDPERDVIVEIATLVTDGSLRVLAEGPNLVIHHAEDVLARMNDYVHAMHTRSGLLERIATSTVSLAEAEAATRAFVQGCCEKGIAPLAGNSVWKDRAFLERYMPEVAGHMHYRIVDVSSIKELVRRWYPESLQAPKKRETHRALDDILESIEELRFYREKIFIPPPPAPPAG